MNKKYKIVLGNDTMIYGQLCADMLRQLGFRVIMTPCNGEAVLAAIQKQAPDLVVMDHQMPEMDAIAVMANVQACKMAQPIFVVTGTYDNTYGLEEVIRHRATLFVKKPYSNEDLCRHITELIENISEHLDMLVSCELHKMGVPLGYNGFEYLCDAIILSIRDPELARSITKRLYPLLAKRYKCSSDSIEAALRSAIEKTWREGNSKVLEKYFGADEKHGLKKKRPSNGAFILAVANQLRSELQKQREGLA